MVGDFTGFIICAVSSKNVIHMHGELLKARCLGTEEVFAWDEDLNLQNSAIK